MRIDCCVCGRQICKDPWSKELQAPLPATHMGIGTYACGDCFKDLDEYGLFPEEKQFV